MWLVVGAMWALALALSPLAVPDTAGVGVDALKANLDLPFDAAAASEEEEPAPDVIYFYGNVYEAKSVVFALDSSGSMLNFGRWGIQTREVLNAISQLNPVSEFGVVYYGSHVFAYRDAPVPAQRPNKTGAIAFVQGKVPSGNTCLFEGVIKALVIARKSVKPLGRSVVLTSDGRPDVCGTGNPATDGQIEDLIGKTLAANPGREVKVHTVWVGSAVDEESVRFMRRLAEAHGGTFRMVSQ
jgi:hypothetical protein